MDTSGHIPDRTSDPTFAEAWALWLAFRCRGTRPLRASTRADYESIHRKHLGPALDSVPLTAIDGSLVARLTIELSDAGISPKRVSNVLVPLRACLRWHHRMGTMPRDPSAWFDPPSRAADERRILTPAQIERLLEALPERHRAMVAFAAYTGVRAGELRALTWADLDLERRAARINKTLYRNRPQRSTKSGRDRVVPVPRHVCRLLLEHRTRSGASETDLVFPGADGRPLDLDTFRARVFKPAVIQAGLPPGTRIHDLRHTSASLYLQSGATVREVMEISTAGASCRRPFATCTPATTWMPPPSGCQRLATPRWARRRRALTTPRPSRRSAGRHDDAPRHGRRQHRTARVCSAA